ncbi:hypothetical protein GCM10009554_06470 [Kribbella koreensis]|uniref:DUF4303 domain-containing protein n=1 Tax=Kribbella koreensis TaxID=57909 RepID=A0ABN1PCU7_9ACTN
MFPEHLYARAAEAIAGFAEPDIYAISLWCSYDEDDTRRPTLVVDYNTETQVEQVLSTDEDAPEPDEARWNYAYWLQSMPVEIGGLSDPTGLRLGQEWIKAGGLWYSDEQEESDFEATLELGSAIARRFEASCLQAGQRLHQEGVLEKAFGRPIPVLVHELEYQPHHADWAIAGNPPELVTEYVAWIESLSS